MKERNTIACCISILIVIGFISILVFGSKGSTFIENGVTYALTVDGVKQNSFPSKGMYRVNTECENATCKWDYEAWKLYIEDITEAVSCNITFTTITKNSFNDYIISLSGTTQGVGSIVNEKGYRYEGQNPNNYVWFNNELWRIIGVMNAESHGISNTNLVKIIRNEPIGGLVWNKSNANDWNESSLKALLNTEYLNSTNGTNGDNCYGYSTTSKAKCDYTTTGIKDTYRTMIREVTWYLGGLSEASKTTETIYEIERSATVFNGRPISGIGKVGLMYVSDYGYAVPEENCSRTINLSSYNNADCSLNNWLYGGGYKWAITPGTATSSYVSVVNSLGIIGYYHSFNGAAVYPTLYLDSSVYILDGDGSETDPYIIAM